MGPEESHHVLAALIAGLESHRLGHAVDVAWLNDYGPGTFFPEIFQSSVPDIQPALRVMLDGPRVIRDAEGHVTILGLADILEVTKRRDVHSMNPEMVELAVRSWVPAVRSSR